MAQNAPVTGFGACRVGITGGDAIADAIGCANSVSKQEQPANKNNSNRLVFILLHYPHNGQSALPQ